MELKLKWSPEVHLVSSPVVDEAALEAFLRDQGVEGWESDAESQGDFIPEVAGRLCYLSFKNPRPGGNAAYLEHIKEARHGSVLEHANYGFLFAGVSRSLTHELVRHRVGLSYSQLSQRYVDESDVAFVVPYALFPSADRVRARRRSESCEELVKERLAQEPFFLWRDSCEMALSYYRQLLPHLEQSSPPELTSTERRKWARQTARSVLPNCTETMIFVTGNARAWRHFVEQRGSRHAEVEIRRLAACVLTTLQTHAPNLFSDYRLDGLPDGTFEITTPYAKV